MSQLTAQIRQLTEEARKDGDFSEARLEPYFRAEVTNYPHKPDEILARVLRGDLSTIDAVPFVGEFWVNERKRWSESILTPEFCAGNFDLCEPLLAIALAGDAIARRQYEKNRLILWDSLPSWAQKTIDEILTLKFPKYELKPKDLPPPARLALFEAGGSYVFRIQGAHVTDCIKDSAFTVTTAQALMESSEAYRAYRKLDQNQIADAIRRNVTTRPGTSMPQFAATDPTPVADYVVKAMNVAITLSFNARLLDDLRISLELPVSDEVLAKALWHGDSTWSATQAPIFQRAIRSRELCLSDPRLADSFHLIFASKKPDGAASNILRESVRASPPPPSNSAPDSAPEAPITHREAMTLALNAALHAINWPDSGRSPVVRGFYALLRRQACTFPEILEGLLEGETPDALIEAFRRRLQPDPETTFTPESRSESSPHSEGESAPIVVRTYRFFDSDAARSIAKLKHPLRRCAQARLLRWVETGNLGDAEKLRFAPGLYAMRIHYGPGIRIYYRVVDDSTITIEHVGLKADYIADINRLGARVA